MSNEIKVSRDGLGALYTTLKSAATQLEIILAEIGCIHNNKVNVSTMDGGPLQSYFCPECGETIEEVIDNEEKELL